MLEEASVKHNFNDPCFSEFQQLIYFELQFILLFLSFCVCVRVITVGSRLSKIWKTESAAGTTTLLKHSGTAYPPSGAGPLFAPCFIICKVAGVYSNSFREAETSVCSRSVWSSTCVCRKRLSTVACKFVIRIGQRKHYLEVKGHGSGIKFT